MGLPYFETIQNVYLFFYLKIEKADQLTLFPWPGPLLPLQILQLDALKVVLHVL
jgi:hypothetical protein